MITAETHTGGYHMEPFENSNYENIPDCPPIQPEQPPYAPPQPSPSAYHGAGTGRKESPYANSPYVMEPQPRQEYYYQPQTEPPVKPKKEKKPRKPMGKKVLAAVLAIVLVAGSCMITAAAVNDYWEDRTEDTVEMLTDKIEALEKQIGKASGSLYG